MGAIFCGGGLNSESLGRFASVRRTLVVTVARNRDAAFNVASTEKNTNLLSGNRMGSDPEYARAYREKNRERLLLQNRIWRERNKEHILEYARKKNKEAYRMDPEKVKQRVRRYVIANRDKVNAMSRKWRRENPEKIKITAANNKYLRTKRIAGNRISKDDWDDIKMAFNSQCAYCGRSDAPLTMDHMIPISRGGQHVKSNIAPACRSCNSRKHTRTSAEYMPEKFLKEE